MRCNNVAFNSVLFACAVIGVCQSVICIILNICAILTFQCVFRIPQYDTDHFVVVTIVKFYFEGSGCKVEGDPPDYFYISDLNLTEPVQVFSWMIAFVIISAIQLFSSVRLLKVRKTGTVRLILKEWCFVTFIVVAMDATLSGIFLRDYFTLQDNLESYNLKDEKGIVAAPAAMSIIAIRGLALWLLNCAFVIYYSVWLFCTSNKTDSDGKKGEKRTDQANGHDNQAFSTFPEFLVPPRGTQRSDFATQEMTQQQRRPSVSSFEAVTRFNEVERPEVVTRKEGEPNRGTDTSRCDCLKWIDKSDINFQTKWQRNIYHSHGCPMLRSELEEKLATIRGSQEQDIKKPKRLTDFSHDIRNFKPGGGRGAAKMAPQRGWIPEPPTPPAAATCNNSSFY